MPEGPSIVILKELVQRFKGKKVLEASSNNQMIDVDLISGKTIVDFKSWGKHFFICFPKFTIEIHLMLFGTYRIDEYSAKLPRLHLQFNDGEINFYACQLHLITEPLSKRYDWSADIMSTKWDTNKAIAKMKAEPKLMVCDALMDQQIFSGVGNIIKNEVLFRTHIHPLSLVSGLPAKKLKELINETIKYAFEFLEWRKEGTLSKHWQAYSQKICPRDHVPILRKNTGKSGRSSYYCDVCQVCY